MAVRTDHTQSTSLHPLIIRGGEGEKRREGGFYLHLSADPYTGGSKDWPHTVNILAPRDFMSWQIICLSYDPNP